MTDCNTAKSDQSSNRRETSPYHQKCVPPYCDAAQTDRFVVAKLQRDELEDKYMVVCDENLQLKRTMKDLRKQIQRLNTQAQRQERIDKREGVIKVHVDDDYCSIQQQNRMLQAKVNVLTQQLKNHSRMHARLHGHSNTKEAEPSQPDNQSELMFDNASKVAQELKYKDLSENNEVGRLKFRIKELEQELKRQQQVYENRLALLESQTEIEKNSDLPGNDANRVIDNVEIIRLRRLSKRQGAQISALSDHVEASDKELVALRKTVEQLNLETEELMERLHKQKEKAQAAQQRAAESVSHTQAVRALEEQVLDLQKELAALKDYNQKLLSLTSHQASNELLKKQDEDLSSSKEKECRQDIESLDLNQGSNITETKSQRSKEVENLPSSNRIQWKEPLESTQSSNITEQKSQRSQEVEDSSSSKRSQEIESLDSTQSSNISEQKSQRSKEVENLSSSKRSQEIESLDSTQSSNISELKSQRSKEVEDLPSSKKIEQSQEIESLDSSQSSNISDPKSQKSKEVEDLTSSKHSQEIEPLDLTQRSNITEISTTRSKEVNVVNLYYTAEEVTISKSDSEDTAPVYLIKPTATPTLTIEKEKTVTLWSSKDDMSVKRQEKESSSDNILKKNNKNGKCDCTCNSNKGEIKLLKNKIKKLQNELNSSKKPVAKCNCTCNSNEEEVELLKERIQLLEEELFKKSQPNNHEMCICNATELSDVLRRGHENSDGLENKLESALHEIIVLRQLLKEAKSRIGNTVCECNQTFQTREILTRNEKTSTTDSISRPETPGELLKPYHSFKDKAVGRTTPMLFKDVETNTGGLIISEYMTEKKGTKEVEYISKPYDSPSSKKKCCKRKLISMNRKKRHRPISAKQENVVSQSSVSSYQPVEKETSKVATEEVKNSTEQFREAERNDPACRCNVSNTIRKKDKKNITFKTTPRKERAQYVSTVPAQESHAKYKEPLLITTIVSVSSLTPKTEKRLKGKSSKKSTKKETFKSISSKTEENHVLKMNSLSYQPISQKMESSINQGYSKEEMKDYLQRPIISIKSRTLISQPLNITDGGSFEICIIGVKIDSNSFQNLMKLESDPEIYIVWKFLGTEMVTKPIKPLQKNGFRNCIFYQGVISQQIIEKSFEHCIKVVCYLLRKDGSSVLVADGELDMSSTLVNPGVMVYRYIDLIGNGMQIELYCSFRLLYSNNMHQIPSDQRYLVTVKEKTQVVPFTYNVSNSPISYKDNLLEESNYENQLILDSYSPEKADTFKYKRPADLGKDEDSNLIINIETLKLNKNCELLQDGNVSLIYIEYSFLGLGGSALETKSQLKNQVMNFKYSKNFTHEVILSKKARDKLRKMLKPESRQILKFLVLSEPYKNEADVKECIELGFADIDLYKSMFLKDQNIVNKKLQVFSNDGKSNFGTLDISVFGIQLMKDISKGSIPKM